MVYDAEGNTHVLEHPVEFDSIGEPLIRIGPGHRGNDRYVREYHPADFAPPPRPGKARHLLMRIGREAAFWTLLGLTGIAIGTWTIARSVAAPLQRR